MAGQEVASAEDFVSVRLIWSSAAHTHRLGPPSMCPLRWSAHRRLLRSPIHVLSCAQGGPPAAGGAPTWGTCGAPPTNLREAPGFFFLCEELVGKTSIDFSGLSARGPPLTRGVHSGVTPGLPPPTPAKRRDIFRRVGNSCAEHPAPFVRFQPGDPPLVHSQRSWLPPYNS